MDELPKVVPGKRKRKLNTPDDVVAKKKCPPRTQREPLDSTTVHPESYALARR